MPYWSEIQIEGRHVDLSHLEPFEFPILPGGSEQLATISVHFHDHCFTESFDSAIHQTVLLTRHSTTKEQRSFSAVRYELSKQLPFIIRGLDGRRIASTREGNLVYVTLANGHIYPVFFTLRRESGRRVRMFVVSAYDWNRPDRPSSTGEMRFNVAVAKVLRGEKPKFPPR